MSKKDGCLDGVLYRTTLGIRLPFFGEVGEVIYY